MKSVPSKLQASSSSAGALLLAAFFAMASLGVAEPLLAGGSLPGFRKSAQSGQDLEAKVAQIFENSCAFFGCHAGSDPPKGLNLSEEFFHARLVDVASVERPDLKRVKPGDPSNSYLVMKVKGLSGIQGKRMPFDAAPLPQDAIATIEAWISSLSQQSAASPPPSEPQPVYPFSGWRVINLPTTQTLDAGLWLFLIGHRFNPKINSGFDTLYGLDGSGIIFLNVGYALTDNLLVNLGRSNASDDVELSLKYRVTQQHLDGGLPFSVAFRGSVNWISEKRRGQSRVRGEAFKFSGQAVFSSQLQPELAIDVVPGLLVNPDIDKGGESPLLTLGLGGRWRFRKNFSLIGEWVPILSGYTPTRTFGNLNRFDSWGGGVEVKVGGHVFQVFVTNSVGIATDQYLLGGDLDIENVDLRFGFNIFRVLKF